MSVEAGTLARIRRNAFLAGYRAGKAHLASAFSLVEILASLYLDGVLRYDPLDPEWDGRDSLILSKGHGALSLYAVLAEIGVLEAQDLVDFCGPGGRLGGEPVVGIPGVEATTGSLGHGLSLGVGEALAYKLDGKRNQVYVILGDGECEEGSVWEAAMSASRYGLGNLVAIVDRNRIQKMGPVEDIAGVSDWEAVWCSLGWHVLVVDGHDVDAITACLKAERPADKPMVVLAGTEKGKGVSLMEGSSAWHWRLPKRRELPTFLEELGISKEELEQCSVRI